MVSRCSFVTRICHNTIDDNRLITNSNTACFLDVSACCIVLFCVVYICFYRDLNSIVFWSRMTSELYNKYYRQGTKTYKK